MGTTYVTARGSESLIFISSVFLREEGSGREERTFGKSSHENINLPRINAKVIANTPAMRTERTNRMRLINIKIKLDSLALSLPFDPTQEKGMRDRTNLVLFLQLQDDG